MAAPKIKIEAPKPGRRDRAVAAVTERLAQLLGLTTRKSALKLGASPLDALCRAAPDLHAAVVYLDLRLRIARALPAVDVGGTAAKAAREDVEKMLAAVSDDETKAAQAWLRKTVGDTPAAKTRDGLLAAIRTRLDAEFALAEKPLARSAAVAAAGGKPAVTAFDQLEGLAAANADVAQALQVFQRSCLLDDSATIARNGAALQDAVRVAGKDARRMTSAIETVVRGFGAAETSADGLKAVEAFFGRFNRLNPNHPMVDVYARLQSWLTTEDLETLGTALARARAIPKTAMSPEKLADAISGKVNVYVGLLGQLIGQKGPYRRLFQEQLVRAQAFAESAAGKGYRVRVGRVPVRGLGRSGTGFAQFYDDTILLVDEAGKKVAIVFTGQFKAGDKASLKVLDQLDSDDAREKLGKLLVDGVQLEIVEGLVPRRSAIITTALGVTEEQTWINGKRVVTRSATDPAAVTAALGDREITFLPMPVDPADLRTLITFLLEAAGKVPVVTR